MSTYEPEQMRQELLMQQAIGAQLDELVRRANQTASELRSDTRLEESQLRNLVNVAISSRSVEVVINFIRYQIGRSGSVWGTGPNDFGHRVIGDLRGKVNDLAGKVIDVLGQEGIADANARRDEVYVRLMQLYLGYLNRSFYYGKKMGSFDRLREVG